MSNLIKERTIGLTYDMTVYHIGVALIHEDKSMSAYGMSFRIEHSHKSGNVQIEAMTTGQNAEFRRWLDEHPGILNGSIDFSGWFRKRRVTNFAFQKIEEAYTKWILEKTKYILPTTKEE